MHLEYVIVGFIAGSLVGLTGMGGGSIVTPLLLYFGIPPVTAVGTDLAYGAITKIAGGAPHIRHRTMDTRVVIRLAAGSLPGSVLGLVALHILRASDAAAADRLIERAVGAILVIVALLTIVFLFRPVRATPADVVSTPPTIVLIASGAVVGFTVAVSSIGSGSLLMAVLLPIWPVSGLTLVGTDIVHGAILTSTAAIGHALTGDIDVRLLVNLLLGSLPGITLSAMAVRHVSSRMLKGIFAVVLFTVGIRLL